MGGGWRLRPGPARCGPSPVACRSPSPERGDGGPAPADLLHPAGGGAQSAALGPVRPPRPGLHLAAHSHHLPDPESGRWWPARGPLLACWGSVGRGWGSPGRPSRGSRRQPGLGPTLGSGPAPLPGAGELTLCPRLSCVLHFPTSSRPAGAWGLPLGGASGTDTWCWVGVLTRAAPAGARLCQEQAELPGETDSAPAPGDRAVPVGETEGNQVNRKANFADDTDAGRCGKLVLSGGPTRATCGILNPNFLTATVSKKKPILIMYFVSSG